MSWNSGHVQNDRSPSYQHADFQQTDRRKPPLAESHPKIYATIKYAGMAAQAAAVGVCGWKSSVILGDPLRSDKEPYGDDVYATLSFATVLMVASLASMFFRCINDKKNHPADFIANPVLLFGAYFAGAAILASQNSKQATAIYNNISDQNLKIWEANHASLVNYQLQLRNCYVMMDGISHGFKKPGCFICPVPSGTSMTTNWGVGLDLENKFDYGLLQYSIFTINQSICEPKDSIIEHYWPDFGSFTANKTLGSWPCDPDSSETDNNPKGLAAKVILGLTLRLYSPFSIQATPFSNGTTSCFHLEGFGTRSFNMGLICNMTDAVLKQYPKEFLTCMTEEFYEEAASYTATFVPYVELPKVLYPGRVLQFQYDGYTQDNVIMFGLFSGFGLFTGLFLECLKPLKKSNGEKQRLLSASAVSQTT